VPGGGCGDDISLDCTRDTYHNLVCPRPGSRSFFTSSCARIDRLLGLLLLSLFLGGFYSRDALVGTSE